MKKIKTIYFSTTTQIYTTRQIQIQKQIERGKKRSGRLILFVFFFSFQILLSTKLYRALDRVQFPEKSLISLTNECMCDYARNILIPSLKFSTNLCQKKERKKNEEPLNEINFCSTKIIENA